MADISPSCIDHKVSIRPNYFIVNPFQVDMEKVNLDTIKPWITKRVTELLGTEDDVLLEFIVNMLEKEKV